MESELKYLETFVENLESAVNRVMDKLGKPLFIIEKDKPRFRFLDKSPVLFQALKYVRLVSLINGLIALLKVGHIHEMGILLRSINESDSEIDFIQDGILNGKATTDQKLTVDKFFDQDLKTTDEMMKEEREFYLAPRRSVWAAIVRLLKGYENPERVRKIHEIIYAGLSGYTHGAYTTIMELYECGTEKFRLKGMLNTPKIAPNLWQIVNSIMGAFNCLNQVALNLEMKELALHLWTRRKELEESALYKQSGQPAPV